MRLRRPVPYEELDHTADAGVIVHGRCKEEALARLVLAYADLVTGGAPVATGADRVVEVAPGDLAAVAVDVLRELLFRLETERWVPESCEVVHFDPQRGARLVIGSAPYDPVAHADGLVLKAVTLHAARFEPEGSGWVAAIVFDV
ncbi:MAG: archease [Polyangiaceae bacterium]|nr:archease [Polyangiaceae bacterium]